MRIIAALLACAATGVAAAQTPQQGDFDGDGRPDTVRVEPEIAPTHERVRVVVQLAARPDENFTLISGPADWPRSIKIMPPGVYQVGTGRTKMDLTLTMDSVKITTEQPGQPARTMLKVWDPSVPAFAGYPLPN